MEEKIEKFKKKYLQNQHDNINDNNVEVDYNYFLQQGEQYNKNRNLYFEEKLEKNFFPFLEQILKKISENFLVSNERYKYQKLSVIKKAFNKIQNKIITKDERKEILASDYATESEDENEIRNLFTKEELEIFDNENINLNYLVSDKKVMQIIKQKLLQKYQTKNLNDFLQEYHCK